MKRREFLAHTAGLAGVLATSASKAQARPCAPPLDGGNVDCPAEDPVPGAAPSWFLNGPEGRWFEVPASNTPRDLGMGLGEYAFAGGVYSTERRWIVRPGTGGHTDSDKNTHYVLDLGAENPAWIVLIEPTIVTDPNDSGTSGRASYASDDAPRSIHGWNQTGFLIGDTFWHPSMLGQWRSGSWGTQVWSVDYSLLSPNTPQATAPWVFHGHGTEEGFNQFGFRYEAGVSAYDPDTGLMWAVAGQNSAGVWPYYSIDSADGTITKYPSHGDGMPNLSRGHCVIVDSHLIMFPASGTVYVMDLNNPGADNMRAANVSGSAPDLDRCGAVVVRHLGTNGRVYINANTNNRLYTLDVPTDVYNGTYTWGSISTPNLPDTGRYSCFNIIDDMGDGRGAFVFQNGRDNPAWVFKVPTA